MTSSLLNVHSQTQMAYRATLWAEFFHSAPHVNITFHQVSSDFDPQSDLYKESLVILGSVPAAWLIATLVVLLIYLCTRCCDSKSTKRRKSRPMRCCLSFFALVAVATLGIGFWGNQLVHDGMVNFQRAMEHIDSTIKQAQTSANKYNSVIQDIDQYMARLYDGPFQNKRNRPQASYNLMEQSEGVFHNASTGVKAMDQLRFVIDDEDKRIDFKQIPFIAKIIEKYRWPTTMVLQSLFAVFCLLLFVGAIVHSRCVLILFSVFGLFSIIFLWLLASAYTMVGVGLADFCYKPTLWVQHIIKDTVKPEISGYYLKCNRMSQSPFAQDIAVAERAIQDIDKRVKEIVGTATQMYSRSELSPELDQLETASADTVSVMRQLDQALQCQPIFRSYNTALVSLCDSGLLGIIVMLLSCAVSGILFTMLVWCNSHTWIYFKHKGRYIKVDDADPYMPLSTIERPRPVLGSGGGPTPLLSHGASAPHAHHPNPYSTASRARTTNIHTPPQTPPYHGTLNGGGMGAGGVHLSNSPYGHLGASAGGGVPQRQPLHHNHMIGTLGRNAPGGHHQQYQGLDNLPATMTLGRRGHYAGGPRSSGRMGGVTAADGDHSGVGNPLLGGTGQYATLSKQCKTLESSDFY